MPNKLTLSNMEIAMSSLKGLLFIFYLKLSNATFPLLSELH